VTNYLQFEVHYLDTKEHSRLTFLCNESRILLQFEFLFQILNFILRKEESKLSGKLHTFTLKAWDNTQNLITHENTKN